jgi:PTH2 family peptidyl-tRNA hydrolase
MADRPPPSAVSVIVATAVLAGISGYMIGIASSLGFLPIPFAPKSQVAGVNPKRSKTAGYDNEEESSEEEIGENELGGALDHAPNWGIDAAGKSKEKREWQDNGEECKLVLVVRTDLGMTKGL